MAGAADRMADKIRRGAIDGVQSSDKVDGGSRNRVTTEQLVEKKVSQGKTRKEALKEIICHNCGKAGHIKAECRSAANAESTASNQRRGKRRSKKSGDALLADDEESDAILAAETEDFEDDAFLLENIDCFMMDGDFEERIAPCAYTDASYDAITDN